jgi:hypothetical protein
MSKNINFGEAINYPFNISDFKNRFLLYSVYSIIIFVISFGLSIFFSIFSTMSLAAESGAAYIIINIISNIIQVIISVITSAYLMGYTFEVAEVIAAKTDISNVKFFDNYKNRLIEGLKYVLTLTVYTIPLMIVVIILLVVMSITLSYTLNGNADPTSVSIMWILLLTIGLIIFTLSLLFSFITPAITVLYIKTRSVKDTLNVYTLYSFVVNHFMNLLMYFGVSFLMVIVMAIAIIISFFTIILCIGIILIPLVALYSYFYYTHFNAYVYGMMLKTEAE